MIVQVFLYKDIYTKLMIIETGATLSDKKTYRAFSLSLTDEVIHPFPILKSKTYRLKKYLDAYFLKPFVTACIQSKSYRVNFLKGLEAKVRSDTKDCILTLKFKPSEKEILDYSWGDRILRIVWSKIELENAFSWLSTLGGAFSALGDHFENCAQMAGKISIRQLQLSKILGDDSLAARSKLYASLALAQTGKLKASRHVVRQVFEFAIATRDVRLIRMCQGVWVKLRYLKEQGENGKIVRRLNSNVKEIFV